jgi:FkbM family methyltransferase
MTQAGAGWRPGGLLDAVVPLAGAVPAPVELHRARVLEGVVVLDYLVHGGCVSFELCSAGDGTWRAEAVARSPVDGPLLNRLGLEKVGRLRFLVGGVRPATRDTLPEELVGLCHDVLRRLVEGGMSRRARTLLDTVALGGPVVVVDVGANPLELPAYTRLLGMGAARVVGFEPQPEAFAQLQGKDPAREVYFPHAIGSPGPHQLHVFESSGFASTFEIDQSSIDFFGNQRWHEGTRLRETIPLELTALDDVPDLPAFDLLKIDVQGGELAVFRSGRRALADAVCVIPEVSFFPLYRDAPTFADVHRELVDQGFQLHKFMFQKSIHLNGSQSTTERVAASQSQLVDGDAVYLRDLRDLGSWTDHQVRALVLLATYVFDSPDLGVQGLDELVRRGRVPGGFPAQYAARRYV